MVGVLVYELAKPFLQLMDFGLRGKSARVSKKLLLKHIRNGTTGINTMYVFICHSWDG